MGAALRRVTAELPITQTSKVLKRPTCAANGGSATSGLVQPEKDGPLCADDESRRRALREQFEARDRGQTCWRSDGTVARTVEARVRVICTALPAVTVAAEHGSRPSSPATVRDAVGPMAITTITSHTCGVPRRRAPRRSS